MKHIKSYDDLEKKIKIGDYITLGKNWYHNQILINCVKVVSKPPRDNVLNMEASVNVEFIGLDNNIDISHLYMSQIGGFASKKVIEKYETIKMAKKYNL